VSTVDHNENLSPVKKFQYLRAAVTGKAARSIQMLEVTDANYSIAFNLLKEKFDYHCRIYMRHWDLIKNYPKIAEETSEAVEDLLKTFKVNLEALDKIGKPITSNIVIIDLLSSKLPSSLIRKWQRTLPNKRMPSYTHLMDFLQTRANSDDIQPRSHKTKGSSQKSSRHRQHQPRG
jgi:ABC-type sulfate transport system substrate-binding protein